MKNKALILILTLALALCPVLAACGKTEGDSTPDSASATQSVRATMPASYVPYAASSAAAASSEENQDAQQDERDQNDQNDNDENKDNAERQADRDDNQDSQDNQDNKDDQDNKEESPASSNGDQEKQSSDSSSAVAEPIYSEDEKPSFTIAVTNKGTKKSYSASCGHMKDDKNAGGVNFFLPGGDYHIAIYPYKNGETMGAPLITKEYTLNGKDDEKKTVKVVFKTDPKSIEVEEVKTDRDQ